MKNHVGILVCDAYNSTASWKSYQLHFVFRQIRVLHDPPFSVLSLSAVIDCGVPQFREFTILISLINKFFNYKEISTHYLGYLLHRC